MEEAESGEDANDACPYHRNVKGSVVDGYAIGRLSCSGLHFSLNFLWLTSHVAGSEC